LHKPFEFDPRSRFKIEFAALARRVEERVFHLLTDFFVEMISKELVDRVFVALTVAPDLFQVEVMSEELVKRVLLDDTDPVSAEDDLGALEAEAYGRRQMSDLVVDEADPFEQCAADIAFDPGDDPMICQPKPDVRINLRELFAEPSVIRGDRRFVSAFALKVEEAYERLRFAIIQFRLARLLFKVSEIHVAPFLPKPLV